MPKVSLVIPCCNVEKYVEQCVRSALAQTLTDIEIICVNDGSVDGTLDILKKLALEDERITIIDKPNSGYGHSMNVGFDAAQGDYIGILESDDFIDSNMLEDHYRVAIDHDLDVVKSNFYFYWSTPREKDVHCDLLEESDCGRVINPLEDRHIFYVKPSIWSALYRSDFIRANNIRFNETPGASYQDASFNFQVWLNAKRVWFIYKAYLHYRQDNEKSSVNSPGKVYCVCDEYDRMETFVDAIEDPETRRQMKAVLIAMKYDSYMWNYDRLTPELGNEFLKRFVSEMEGHIDRGELDWSAFRSDKAYELRLMLTDLDFMLTRHHAYLSRKSSVGRMIDYFKAGGLNYVMKPFLNRDLAREE